jgi:Leucine-rich repeat (LRR) protein
MAQHSGDKRTHYYDNQTRYNDLEKAFKHKSDVKELSLTGIEVLPSEFYELTHLTKLTIRKGLKKIDDRIENFRSLEQLNLIDVELSKLPIEIKYCTNLKEIRVINSKLDELPKELFELPRLQILILKNNRIERLPCDFIDNYSIKELNLKYNKISLFPDCIQRLYNIEALYLSGNPFGLVQGRISVEKGFRNLRTLSMSDCNLESIPTELTKNVSYLDLSSNKIKDITFDDVQALAKVRFLSIENNPLTYLDESVLKIGSLTTLQIDMNDEIADALLMSSRVCVAYVGRGYHRLLDQISPCGKKKNMITVFLYEPIKKISRER